MFHFDDLPIGEIPPGVEPNPNAFRHGVKLDELARRISQVASPEDGLLFFDGDAVLLCPGEDLLAGPAPLVAVRRDENAGDRFPHPSFCLTTVAFWDALGGDWRRGAFSTAQHGDRVSDTGGRVLEMLEMRGLQCRPLTRRNAIDLHPLWFGVYGDETSRAVVYHHGAGFRSRESRVDPPPRQGSFIGRRAFWRRQKNLDRRVMRWMAADPEHWVARRLLGESLRR